jgi:hypothetical protein
MTAMLYLTIPPDCADYPAAAFTQDGRLLVAGPREECEQVARDNSGLYCWIDRGRPVIRRDFQDSED